MPFDFCARQSGKVNRDYQMLHAQCHLSGCICKGIFAIVVLKLFKLLKCWIWVQNIYMLHANQKYNKYIVQECVVFEVVFYCLFVWVFKVNIA